MMERIAVRRSSPTAFVLRQDEDLNPGMGLFDLDRRFEPSETRHGDVHQHDVRSGPLHRLDRLHTVSGLANDLELLGHAQE
jgi:hypothetical protein